nr:serine acetyltransferase [Microbacterium laevaniformans]
MHHPNGIVLGAGSRLGKNCTILQQVTLGERYANGLGPSTYPTLGDNVTIGAGAKVLGGVMIGDGVQVGANSVVLSDLPPGATAVGAPARAVQPKHQTGT